MRDFKQNFKDDGYFRQEELTFWDCDCAERMRVAAVLSKIAVFGGYHYNALGLDRQRLLDSGFVFLLSRVTVRFHHIPRASQVLTVHTWENGARGAQIQRVFQMSDESGALCISARSDWVLADPYTHKMLRPSAFTLRSLGTCPREIDCPEPKRLSLAKEDLQELGQRQIVWSDLDGNGHLFSGNYGDIFWDFLPGDLQNRTPADFAIQYSRESKLGDVLHLRGVRTENGFRMEGAGENGTYFTAQCDFAEK